MRIVIAAILALTLVGCAARTTREIVDLGALREIPVHKPYKETAECALGNLDAEMCFDTLFEKVCPLNRLRYIETKKEAEIIGQYPSGNRFVVTIQSSGETTSLAKFYITDGGLLRQTAADKAASAIAKCD